MAVRRFGVLVALVVAMTAGLVACDPPAGSGLTITATSRTTGLEPGDPITIRITGAESGQAVELFACAREDCLPLPGQTVTTDRNGTATVRWRAAGTAGSEHYASGWEHPRPVACRAPDACRLYAAVGREPIGSENPNGPIGLSPTSVGYTLKGRQVQFTATPTQDFVGGDRITVRGSVKGATGRKVRIARVFQFEQRNDWWTEKVGASVYVTVKADGTFSGTYTLPPTIEEADCAPGPDGPGACYLSAWIVKADGSAIDPSFGKPLAYLHFDE